jgi:hypothetical protein
VAATIEKFLEPAVVGRYCDEIEDIWQRATGYKYLRVASVGRSGNAAGGGRGTLKVMR